MSERVGFIGLGIMGLGRNLLAAGFDLVVYNRHVPQFHLRPRVVLRAVAARVFERLGVAHGPGQVTPSGGEQIQAGVARDIEAG
jgi:hypothetical protein